jgi:hypothetical protein
VDGKLFRALLDKGADPHAINGDGVNALLASCVSRKLRLTLALMRLGCRLPTDAASNGPAPPAPALPQANAQAPPSSPPPASAAGAAPVAASVEVKAVAPPPSPATAAAPVAGVPAAGATPAASDLKIGAARMRSASYAAGSVMDGVSEALLRASISELLTAQPTLSHALSGCDNAIVDVFAYALTSDPLP